MVYRPFSLPTSPEGKIEDEYLCINLNSSSYFATINIYKEGAEIFDYSNSQNGLSSNYKYHLQYSIISVK